MQSPRQVTPPELPGSTGADDGLGATEGGSRFGRDHAGDDPPPPPPPAGGSGGTAQRPWSRAGGGAVDDVDEDEDAASEADLQGRLLMDADSVVLDSGRR